MAKKRRVGRPKKKKRAVKKKFVRVSVIDGRLKERKKKKRGRRRLPPRVKSGKNKGRFKKRGR